MSALQPVNSADSSPDAVLQYYLREDVSSVLWQLCRRRALRFFYHSDVDLRLHRGPVRSRVLHCLSSASVFRDIVEVSVKSAGASASGFFPFCNMGQAANVPGEPLQVVGWDLRLEVDLDRVQSFRALLPALALLEYFGVPTLAKYSGSRSLHLSIPAEAFPASLRRQPEHSEWMRTMDQVTGLLMRFAPGLDSTTAHLAKETVLTTPYSLHRYAGRVSLPLSLNEALKFDPEGSCLSRFSGALWQPQNWDRDPDGAAMTRLLYAAGQAQGSPEFLLELAERVFAGAGNSFVSPTESRDDPIRTVLCSGLPAIALIKRLPDVQQRQRLVRAAAAIDLPSAKEPALLRTIVSQGFVPEPTAPARRRAAIGAVFETWVVGGIEAALDKLIAAASDATLARPVQFALHMAALLPDPAEVRFAALRKRWQRLAARDVKPETVLLALALAELSSDVPMALEDLVSDVTTGDERAALLACLRSSGRWQSTQHPHLATAALLLVFGRQAVDAQRAGLLREVLGDENKQKFALTRLERELRRN